VPTVRTSVTETLGRCHQSAGPSLKTWDSREITELLTVYLAAVLELRELGMGLAFKLVLGPAIVAVLFAGLLDARGETIQITIFEASMAPQIGAAIVAVDHDLDPALVTLMVGIGIPLSFLTVPLWWYVLRPLAP
jgi:hypothetical protein